jgi:chitinase
MSIFRFPLLPACFRSATLLTAGLLAGLVSAGAQIPGPVLSGYFHNWQDPNAPYVPLDQVDTRYNLVQVAFALPKPGTDYDMAFVPDQVSTAAFAAQMQTLRDQGRKVLLSIGGATAPVSLDNSLERDVFVASVGEILAEYPFDGLDLDLEGGSLSLTGGTIAQPVDSPVIHLISAVRDIMDGYRQQHDRKMLLTMAPETAYLQGGQAAYGSIWGAYLPVLDALRDSLDLVQLQLYNSGSMPGLDGNAYTQGTADFLVAMTEAVIQGFPTAGGLFEGIPADKVAVGLPACQMAAGGGFTIPATTRSALDYLRGMGPQPGNYTLVETAGYPALAGLMTWSVNWDATPGCGEGYGFAQQFEDIFTSPTTVPLPAGLPTAAAYPNPCRDWLTLPVPKDSPPAATVRIFDAAGRLVRRQDHLPADGTIDLSGLPAGMYSVIAGREVFRFVRQGG